MIMYKARVQTVSGTKVRAGGKWLTCIGNKNVRVGDSVWTDGRCVYGNEDTPQQPFVIIAPNEEWGIPIVANRQYFTYDKNLKKHTDIGSDTVAMKILPKIKILTNDKKGNVYISTNENILAANSDNFGNVYYLIEDGDNINIVKNGEVVKIVENPAKTKAPKEAAAHFPKDPYSLSGEPVYMQDIQFDIEDQPIVEPNGGEELFEYGWFQLRYTKYCRGYKVLERDIDGFYTPFQDIDSNPNCEWAFIENENNWAIIFTNTISVDGYYATSVYDNLKMTSVLWGKGYMLHWVDFYNYSGDFSYVYFITPNENKLIFEASDTFGWSEGFDYDPTSADYIIAGWTGIPFSKKIAPKRDDPPVQCNYENFIGTKIPIQDGFYYVIQSVILDEPSTYLTSVMNITIYTEGDKKILAGTFSTIPYISICKVSDGKYLMAINRRNGSYKEYPSNENHDYNYLYDIGLYEIIDGVATRLKSTTYSTYTLANQCLRSMKKIKRWWERIQTIE